jgi:ABC-type transport system involved in multi-copper enzyme maturation permease subunit
MDMTPATGHTDDGVQASVQRLIRRVYPVPNPVLVKELRARFRGGRAFAMMTVYLFVVSAAVLLALRTVGGMMSAGYPGQTANSGSILGTTIFSVVLGLETLLIMLIGPLLTAGAVSGEKERQTWELLLATPLTGQEILRGKVGAAMAYVALLVFAALPVTSLSFVFGGVSLISVLSSQLQLLATGLVYTSLGALASTVTPSTMRAVVASYAVVVVLSCGGICWLPSMLTMGVMSSLAQGGSAVAASMAMSQVVSAAGSLLLGSALLLAAGSRIRPGSRSVAGLIMALLALWFILSACVGPILSSGVMQGMMNGSLGPVP